MFKLFAWTRYRFDTETKASRLIDLFADGPLAPDTFGRGEPPRQKLTTGSRRKAAALLGGGPAHQGGAVFLGAQRPPSTTFVQWSPAGLDQWYCEFDDSLVSSAERRSELVGMYTRLFGEFQIAFAGLANADEWQRKHWIVETFDDGGETHTKVGLDPAKCLPGVYWTTHFGPRLVQRFGRDVLLELPGTRAVDLGEAGITVVIDADPTDAESVLSRERAILDQLGSSNFFDIAHPHRPCESLEV